MELNKKYVWGGVLAIAAVIIILATVKNDLPGAATAADTFVESTIATGLSQPTAMEFAPDGRLFVLEKAGRARIIKNGTLLGTPFVTVSTLTDAERGLIGIAFDPNFASNGYVYLHYTRTSGVNAVSRFTASGDVAVPGSEITILTLESSGGPAHNGGGLHFGLDGKLYLSVGAYDSANSQNLGRRQGKILRINSDGSIPSDNPFVTTSGARGEIWAYGFRNPFSFAVDPTTGKINVNDVGEGTWEEINTLTKGGNYGWPLCEGPQNSGVGSCTNSSFVYPIFAYNHNGGSAAVTGGAFYRGTQFPSTYYGAYFFGDYTRSYIKYLNTSNQVVDWRAAASPVDIKIGPDGSLYYASIYNGNVYKVMYGSGTTPPPPPPPPPPTYPSNAAPVATITTPATGTLYNAGNTISYSGSGTDAEDGTLAASKFSWMIIFHHDTHTHPFLGPIDGVTSGTFTIPNTGEVSANVWYQIQLTVTDSTGLTNVVSRDVTPRKVTLTINTNPTGGTLTLGGQPLPTPITTDSVISFIRNIGAPATQTINGQSYTFTSWSDGGAATHDITTPASNTTYTANYTLSSGSNFIKGDINKDGIVNSLDWSLMNSKWLTSDVDADLNADGIVNSIDFSIINNNWFKTSS